MTTLSVNLNKVALLRNQRDIGYPCVIEMARIALAAGAEGITVHPRPDERHTRKTDVRDLARFLRAHPSAELNIEGYPTDDFLDLVAEVGPQQVTLVPDAPDQKTSDHGWDFNTDGSFLTETIAQIKRKTTARVSLFIDHESPAIAEAAAATRTDAVELYTGPYFIAFDTADQEATLSLFHATAQAAHTAGLLVNAGHDLNLDNLGPFLKKIPWIAEVSIGHALTADALRMGMAGAVTAYADLTKKHQR